jgi:uncharacterized protein YpmB
MWTTIVMLLFIILFFLSLGVLKQKEGFDNPYTASQQQQGDIATLTKQLSKITISDEYLNTMQEQITDLSKNTTTLQVNVPTKEMKEYTQV